MITCFFVNLKKYVTMDFFSPQININDITIEAYVCKIYKYICIAKTIKYYTPPVLHYILHYDRFCGQQNILH